MNEQDQAKRMLLNIYKKQKQSLNLFQVWQWRFILNSNPSFHVFIRQLNLSRLSLNDDEIAFIFGKNWPALEILWLMSNHVTNQGVKLILNKKIPSIKQLMLNDNKIDSSGIRLMMDCDLHKIIRLKLNNNRIGCKGVQYLQKVTIPNLRELQLQQCQIGNKGMRNLCKANWPQLKQIYLQSNAITSTGFTYLSMNQWAELCYIQIDFNKVYGIDVVGLVSMQAHVSQNRENVIVLWRIAIFNEGISKKLTQVMTNRFDRRWI